MGFLHQYLQALLSDSLSCLNDDVDLGTGRLAVPLPAKAASKNLSLPQLDPGHGAQIHRQEESGDISPRPSLSKRPSHK
jgi:hypothetical protein